MKSKISFCLLVRCMRTPMAPGPEHPRLLYPAKVPGGERPVALGAIRKDGENQSLACARWRRSLGAAAWFQPSVAGSDLWWHLAAGREILQTTQPADRRSLLVHLRGPSVDAPRVALGRRLLARVRPRARSSSRGRISRCSSRCSQSRSRSPDATAARRSARAARCGLRPRRRTGSSTSARTR